MMHTSKDLLPAINSLYDFGLTEQEMTNLTLKIEKINAKKIEADEDNSLTPEQKLQNSLYDSISYVLRKGNILLTGTPQRYHSKDVITIQKLDEDHDERVLLELKDNTPYYVMSLHGNAREKLDDGQIIFERFSFKNIDQLIATRYLIGKLYKGASFTHLPNVLKKQNYSSNGYHYTMFKNTQEFITKTKEVFLQTEDINTKFEQVRDGITVATLMKFFQTLYPDALTTKGKLTPDSRSTLKSMTKLSYILGVVECNNYRVAFNVNFKDSYYSDSELECDISIVPHTHDTYNYVDIGRLFYRKRNSRSSYYYDDNEYRPFGDLMFIAEEPVLPKEDVITDYLDKNGEMHFLDDHQLGLISKRYLQKQNRIKAEEDAKQRLADKIQNKLDALKTVKGVLKINDVVYTQNKITYQDQELIGSGLNWVYDLLRYQTGAYNLNSVTFDTIFSSFINKTRKDDGDYGYDSGTVGNVNFNIESQVLTNKLNISSTRWKINGYRVNTAEIHKCIERAICFEEQTDFDYFIKSVSACSLKMHRYLQLGLDINVRDHFDGTEVVLKFPLERIKNLNYLVLNDQEYKIRNTEKLLRLERADTIIDVINTLLSGEVVENVQASDVKELIEAGKKAYIDAVEKSKELLQSCEEVLGIKEERIKLKDGNEFTGYRIKGELRDYAVNSKDERYSVYDEDTASYICIVDKTNSAQAGLDRLVNRLYALSNDSRVATKINTLKRRSTQNES